MPIAISGRTVTPSPGDFQTLSEFEEQPPRGSTAVPRPLNKNTINVQRSMKQAITPGLSYKFKQPPVSFTHEGYGVTLNEINRPYSTPIVDITGGKALRCSFEFVVVEDGLEIPVDNKISLLQEIANFGIPVDFDNVHPALSTPLWHIDNITFSHTRINSDGKTAAASCNLSLIEFRPRNEKMILLPRFSYGKFKPPGKPPKTPTTGPPWDDPAALREYIAKLMATDPEAARWVAKQAELNAARKP